VHSPSYRELIDIIKFILEIPPIQAIEDYWIYQSITFITPYPIPSRWPRREDLRFHQLASIIPSGALESTFTPSFLPSFHPFPRINRRCKIGRENLFYTSESRALPIECQQCFFIPAKNTRFRTQPRKYTSTSS